MTTEELKSIWTEQDKLARPVTVTPEVIWRLSRESAKFERCVFWRDTREWLATFLVAACFIAFGLQNGVHWLPIVAAIVCFLPMSYVTFLRWQLPAPKTAPTLVSHLQESIASVQHQIGLLRSIVWWYLSPCAIGVTLIFIEGVRQMPHPLDGRAYFGLIQTVLFCTVVFLVIWKRNQRFVRKSLQPRLRALEKTLAELES
jgi:hypothetical protein